jgi:hypothetical protein
MIRLRDDSGRVRERPPGRHGLVLLGFTSEDPLTCAWAVDAADEQLATESLMLGRRRAANRTPDRRRTLRSADERVRLLRGGRLNPQRLPRNPDVLGWMAAVILDSTIPDKRDPLAGFQRGITVGHNAREMDEQNLAVIGRDATVSLLVLAPANGPWSPYSAKVWSADIQAVGHRPIVRGALACPGANLERTAGGSGGPGFGE